MPAILTVTLNPAVDLYTSTPRVEPTHKLRCGPALLHPGGGGINVARVLTRLGIDALALHAAGGATGRLLAELLQAEGVRSHAIPIAGETRQSFSAHEQASGLDYRFVLPGPQLAEREWQACLDAAAAQSVDGALAVASGSLPPGAPTDFYARLARRLADVGVRLVLDTSGPALAAALQAGVYLVKPSLRELRELTGTALDTPAQQLAACRALVRLGQAEVVALSLGAEGALVVSAQQAWTAAALQVPVASTIGAGDSFVAGLVASLAGGAGLRDALARGSAAAAAALLTSGTALCQADDVARLLPQVRVRALE
ncbi:1-phosphofructokinase family hexose kinase [Caenimonas terrae]|uniref:Phosphofructokinase n=1 Tax=Caenimonas terrae TaxID=696074 RepID=A0ABW0NG83_9BURK